MTQTEKKKMTILGAPFCGGQGKPGVDEAPKMLEESGLAKEIEALGWDASWKHLDFPEVPNDHVTLNMKRPRYVSSACHSLYETMSNAAKDGFVLTVGGDHAIGIGTVAAALRANPDAVVVWVDAHADINTPASTESGNLHGCPLSFVTGIDGLAQDPENDIFNWVPRGSLDFSRLAYIGLRDVDDYEKKVLRENNVAAYSMHDVDRYGIAKVVDMALEKVNPGLKLPIHLSFDVDALDPFFAPSTGTPVRGGLTWREGCYICEAIAETGQLVSMDLVECNPHLGENELQVRETLQSGIALIKSALGQTLL